MKMMSDKSREMTRRAKGWGEPRPRKVKSYTERGGAPVRRCLVLVVMLFALGGCAEFLGAAAFQGISFFTSATEQDIGLAAISLQSQQQVVDRCREKLMEYTMAQDTENFDTTKKLCDKTLAFLRAEKPKLWSRRLADRWSDFSADDSVVPNPQILVPPAGPPK